jgi:hypothetical protein
VIRHHHKSMQFVVSEFSGIEVNSLNHHLSQSWLAKVEGAGLGLIQKPIQVANALPELAALSGKALFGGKLP